VDQVHGVPRGLELLVGLLADDPTRALDPIRTAQASAEAALLALVTQGFELLDSVERAVVQHMALANAPVPAPALERILEGQHSGREVNDAVSRLVRRRMLGLDQTGSVRLHPVDTDFVARSLVDDPEERARIDLRIATWLSSQHKEPSSWRTSTDVAAQRREFQHRTRGGDLSGAILLLYDMAEFLTHHGEADRVKRMLHSIPMPLAKSELVRYHHILGLIGLFDGGLDEAIASFRTARTMAEQLDQTLLTAKANTWLGIALRHAGRAHDSLIPLQEAVQKPAPGEAGRHVALLALFELALSQCYLRCFEDAMSTTISLSENLAVSDSPEVEAFLYDARALVHLGMGDFAQALSAVNEGLEKYANSPMAPTAAFLINVRGLVHLVQGDEQEAMLHFSEVITQTELTRDTRLEGLASLNLAWAHLLAGDRSLCAAYAERAVARLQSNAVAEGESAVMLLNACGEEDASSMLEDLRRAVIGSLGNPDLFQPSDDKLRELAQSC
jgi:tetratricopeptide (TPR) repeat protein